MVSLKATPTELQDLLMKTASRQDGEEELREVSKAMSRGAQTKAPLEAICGKRC